MQVAKRKGRAEKRQQEQRHRGVKTGIGVKSRPGRMDWSGKQENAKERRPSERTGEPSEQMQILERAP